MTVNKGFELAAPQKKRMQKLRQKREGRALSVWLYADAARKFANIKKLTGETNDGFVNNAIRDAYETIFAKHCFDIINRIRSKHDEPDKTHVELTALYCDLVGLLQLDYHRANAVKKFLINSEVPNYSGKTGTWKVSQVRKLMEKIR